MNPRGNQVVRAYNYYGGYSRGNRVSYRPAPNLYRPRRSVYRPLIRVIARVDAENNEDRTPPKNGPDSQDAVNAYRMEVNEFQPREPTNQSVTQNDSSRHNQHYVTVFDLLKVVPDIIHRRVWIPISLVEEISEYLKSCMTDSKSHTYNVSRLQDRTFYSDRTKQKVEIRTVKNLNQTNLYTFMDNHRVDDTSGLDMVEVINLRDDILARFVKFLDEVALRYRELSKPPSISSLYTRSGERRFFFDLKDTRWGRRLLVSQVTDKYRNVIGIPVESLVQFRDRIDKTIQSLRLDEMNESSSKLPTKADFKEVEGGQKNPANLGERHSAGGSSVPNSSQSNKTVQGGQA